MSVRKRKWTTEKGAEKEAWIVDYFDQYRKRRLKTFARKKDADAFSAATHVEIREGTHVADRATITVREAGYDWIKSGENDGLERTTVDQRRQHLKHHIIPLIGHDKLSKLTIPLVRAFQDRLREQGRSAAMVKRITVSLGSILTDAQERGLLARNAVREMSRQRRRGSASQGESRQKARLKIGKDIPAPAEMAAILHAATGRWRPFLLTATFTGMRASELRGLRWTDVDLKKREIHVRQRADRYRDIGMPKTDSSQRTIPLPPIVANALKEWKLACPKGDLDLVFPNGAGNVEDHPNIIERGFKPTLIAAGVVKGGGAKYTGLHSLRHFYASWCINQKEDGGLGLPPKVVQERLGHSSIMVTMDTYGHLFPRGDDAEELAAAERALMSAHAT